MQYCSLKAGPHQQQCRSNIVECYKSNDSFDEISRKTRLTSCLTLLPKTATMSRQHLTLSKRRCFSTISFDIVAVFGKKVECCFDKVERCFHIVAVVDGALVFKLLSALGQLQFLTPRLQTFPLDPMHSHWGIVLREPTIGSRYLAYHHFGL